MDGFFKFSYGMKKKKKRRKKGWRERLIYSSLLWDPLEAQLFDWMEEASTKWRIEVSRLIKIFFCPLLLQWNQVLIHAAFARPLWNNPDPLLRRVWLCFWDSKKMSLGMMSEFVTAVTWRLKGNGIAQSPPALQPKEEEKGAGWDTCQANGLTFLRTSKKSSTTNSVS